MFRFLRHTERPLYVFSGAVQLNTVKTLYTSNVLSQSDVQNLIHFCYPISSKIAGPSFFVNRFRPTSGRFYNIFCFIDQTSFNLKELDRNEPCCLCIVSEFDEPGAFEEVLRCVRNLLLSSTKSAENFLNNLVAASAQNIDMLNKYLMQPLKVTENISLMTLGLLIIGLLSDASFIVVSSDIEKISKFCYDLQILILPLKWHHIFVPILPLKFIDTIQSPAPFIVGLHRSLLKKAQKADVEGHILIDIDDQYSICTKDMETIPNWAMQIAGGLESSSLVDRQSMIMKIICRALGIQPANASLVTAKRINSAIQYIRFEPNSFVFSLLNSRTLQSFFDAMKERSMPREYKKLLERANSSAVTSLAVQKVDEFPLTNRKPMHKKIDSNESTKNRRKSVLEADSSSGSSPVIDITE